MCRLDYFLVFLIPLFCYSAIVYASENVTTEVPVETLVNLTGHNELWTLLLRDCGNPSLACVQKNIYKYLKEALDQTDDLQFTSFLRFTRNSLDYERIKRSFDFDSNGTSGDHISEDEFPIESMSRSLQDNTAKFLITHDLEISLPDTLFPNSILKISPRGLESNGTLVNLEVVSTNHDAESREGALAKGPRTFKKIRKFINEKIIYAILALLLIAKLLAVKFLFVLPLLVGAATAKKLLLKILLFVFPFLHHVFKFCAYYPIQAKFHHHKHLISHIHQVSPHHHDHHGPYEGVEVIGPHAYGPPPGEHHGYHDDYYSDSDDVSVFPDDGSGFPHGPWLIKLLKSLLGKTVQWSIFLVPKIIKTAITNPWIRRIGTHFFNRSLYFLIAYLPGITRALTAKLISHRKDPTREDNEISYGHKQPARRKPSRPLTSAEIERMLANAEKEAIIKARLEKERLRIREENLRLQEQLNQAIKLQEKLKQQTVYLNKKIPPTKIASSVPYSKPIGNINPPPLKGSPFDQGPGIELPAGYIPQHTVPQRPHVSQPVQQKTPFDYKYHNVDPDHFEKQYQASIQSNFDQQYQSSQVNTQYQSASSLPNQGPVYKHQPLNTANSGTNEKQSSISTKVDIQKSVEYDPRNGKFDNSKEVQTSQNDFFKHSSKKTFETSDIPKAVEKASSGSKPKLEQEIYQAASITYDKFYSPILEKIDKILQGLGFIDEPCKERLICSMYKSPTTFSPHSNLLSAELSRDSSELQKPMSTNSVVVRFYKYVQAARDGQDQRDCLRLYPTCPINTELS